MKKRAKKLVLAKETVRGLDLERVVGAVGASWDEQNTCFSTYNSVCPYNCDLQETAFYTCIE